MEARRRSAGEHGSPARTAVGCYRSGARLALPLAVLAVAACSSDDDGPAARVSEDGVPVPVQLRMIDPGTLRLDGTIAGEPFSLDGPDRNGRWIISASVPGGVPLPTTLVWTQSDGLELAVLETELPAVTRDGPLRIGASGYATTGVAVRRRRRRGLERRRAALRVRPPRPELGARRVRRLRVLAALHRRRPRTAPRGRAVRPVRRRGRGHRTAGRADGAGHRVRADGQRVRGELRVRRLQSRRARRCRRAGPPRRPTHRRRRGLRRLAGLDLDRGARGDHERRFVRRHRVHDAGRDHGRRPIGWRQRPDRRRTRRVRHRRRPERRPVRGRRAALDRSRRRDRLRLE